MRHPKVLIWRGTKVELIQISNSGKYRIILNPSQTESYIVQSKILNRWITTDAFQNFKSAFKSYLVLAGSNKEADRRTLGA